MKIGGYLAAFFATAVVMTGLGNISEAKEASGEVNLSISFDAPETSKDVKVWIPYPVSGDYQTIENVKVEGNYTYSGVHAEKENGNMVLYAEWTKPSKERTINLSFKATAREVVRKNFPAAESSIPVEVLPFLKETETIPLGGKVRETALKATQGKTTILQKAEAVYDWTVANTFRDNNVKGCGTGDVERMLSEHGGKCADISTVFVALARAAGVPARDVFGITLGKKDGDDLTSSLHCWTEFYLPGYGWVPTDPGDVRKAMLKKNLELKDAKEYRDYFFGAVDEYHVRMVTDGRGVHFNPPQKDGALNYFLYPYAEIDGKQIDWLAGQKELKYKLTFKKSDTREAMSRE